MAPRKEKSEKASSDQASDLILQYLRKQKSVQAARSSAILGMVSIDAVKGLQIEIATLKGPKLTPPVLQATDISSNLHNKVTKTNAAKILKEMHERNEIVGRLAGKQSVYHVIQEPDDNATPEELATMDHEISTIREETSTAKADEKALKATLGTLTGTMSTHDLREAVHTLELEIKNINARLDPLRSGNVVPISAEERFLVDKQWHQAHIVLDARRKGCRALWMDLSEQLPEGLTKADLWENLGLEEDP